jgi:hypothetical protein
LFCVAARMSEISLSTFFARHPSQYLLLQ